MSLNVKPRKKLKNIKEKQQYFGMHSRETKKNIPYVLREKLQL